MLYRKGWQRGNSSLYLLIKVSAYNGLNSIVAVGIVEGVLAYHVAVRLSDLVELVKQGANRLLALHFRDRL